MTEKRFKLKYSFNKQYPSASLYDNKTFIGSIGIGGELIVELLNNLSEENEELQHECNYLQNRLDDFINIQKENEQLKSEINMLKTTIGRNEAYIKRLTHQSEYHN